MKKLALVLAALLVLSSVSALAVDWNETGLPIVNEPYSFSIMVDDSGLEEDKIMIPIIEAETGIDVDWQIAPYAVQTEKLGIALSSGDYADVIAGWILGDQHLIDMGMGDQTFLPLEDLFEKYAPNIMEVLDKPGVRASMTLPDGHIYSIPYVVNEPEVFYIPYINQQWLDRLGLEMPTTPEELKEVLIAFRDQDANGNGDPSDEIPFSGDPNNLDISKLAGWWGVDAAAQKNQFPYFSLVDGELVFGANTEAYKSMILYFADLYAEGLVDPEIFTQDVATWSAKGKQDLYGVDISYGPGDAYDDFPADSEEYVTYVKNAMHPLPVLAGVDNPVYHRTTNGVTLFRTQAVITDKADEEKAAIITRWFDYLFSADVSWQTSSGPFDICIVKLGEGLYQETDQSEWSEEKKEQYSWGNRFVTSMPRYYHNDSSVANPAVCLPFGKDEPDPDLQNEMKMELYGPYLNERFPEVWGTSEEDTSRSAEIRADLENYIKTKTAQWIAGQADVEAEWDAYCEQLNAYGLEELTEINRRALGME
jgi:putative aldouronate transport system substrate-binding protein